VGVRQLRDPVQGVAPGGRAARPVREGRRRGQGARADRSRTARRAAHPWDKVDDYGALAAHAESLGVHLGTVNSNTFQDDEYKLGSLTHAEKTVRRRAIDHHIECIDVMDRTGSRDLKIWLADGTNYPGQGDIRARQEWLLESLHEIYAHLGDDQRLVLEYKFFEPAFYHTGRPGLGYRVRPRQRAGTQGVRLPRHRPPRARDQHRVHRRPAAAAREARLVRLQQPLLRRRRPHRRGGRPVPAVPHPVRGGPWRRGTGGSPRWPSCWTSATTSRRRSPARSGRCSTSRR
jgi:hypothetical protein